MYPPVFSLAVASGGVTALLGATPTRLWPFDRAPQSPTKPYVVWQQTSGVPENYLGTLPDADNFTAQIDVYADTADSARDVAEALRDAFEPSAYVTRWSGESRDSETNNYRFSFDVDFIVTR